jgi:hypothetical protein
MKRTPTDFPFQELQTLDSRLCLEEVTRIPRDWWKKRPKVEKTSQRRERIGGDNT